MNDARDRAIGVFRDKGFPTRKVERYKYTDVAACFEPEYGIALGPLDVADSPYVTTIGRGGVTATRHYATVADMDDPLTALNTALAHDGVLIHVPRGVRVETPIQVDNWLRGDVPTMMNRRMLIVLEQSAEATIIIHDHADDGQRFLSTQVIEVVAMDNSSLDMYEVEETNKSCSRFSNVYVRMGRDCRVKHNSITLNNGLTRNLCDVYLQGENSEVTLNGCAIGDGQQHIDNNTLIDHQVPNCVSDELYKYVLDDKSVGAFAGRVLVRKDAQKTSSRETNSNLCSSPEARMYTQPMLEIYADDVKCAHGSTVGVMDETALFYMRQRGVPEALARMLLKNAFMGQVIDQIRYQPLRDKLFVKVEKRFRGELEKCGVCGLCK